MIASARTHGRAICSVVYCILHTIWCFLLYAWTIGPLAGNVFGTGGGHFVSDSSYVPGTHSLPSFEFAVKKSRFCTFSVFFGSQRRRTIRTRVHAFAPALLLLLFLPFSVTHHQPFLSRSRLSALTLFFSPSLLLLDAPSCRTLSRSNENLAARNKY